MTLIANDDTAATSPGQPVTVNVLANDTLDGVPVQLSDLSGLPIIQQPSQGVATVNPDGTITYTPPEGFVGEVEIPYTISTEDEGCAEGQGFRTGDLSLTIPPSWWGSVLDGDQVAVESQAGDWGILYICQDGVAVFSYMEGEPPYEEVEAILLHARNDEILNEQCIHFTWTAI